MSHTDVTSRHGWSLYGHPSFLSRLEELTAEVERLAEEDPDGFRHHPSFKLLDCVLSCILERVPANPGHNDFALGRTLGKGRGHWRRVKNGLPQRFRLFFQYSSTPPKTIIFAWLNDDETLRKKGSKSDVYQVFLKAVESGKMPNSYQELLALAKELPDPKAEKPAA